MSMELFSSPAAIAFFALMLAFSALSAATRPPYSYISGAAVALTSAICAVFMLHDGISLRTAALVYMAALFVWALSYTVASCIRARRATGKRGTDDTADIPASTSAEAPADASDENPEVAK